MKTFEELDLVPQLHKALKEQNYKIPTPIQAKSIPAALSGQDILGCAQTGTGKTAAFALPTLNHLATLRAKPVRNRPVALILAPTRELVVQIGESFATYGKFLSLKKTLVYGGVSQQPQVQSIRRGTHIIVATPGRLLDLINQGHINLEQLEIFALDEVDRMLDMGFLPDIKRIIRHLPEERQSMFFSATLPKEIRSLTKHLLRDPWTVTVSPKSPTVDKIEQQVRMVDNNQKLGELKTILSSGSVDQAVVFTNTKRKANTTVEKLKRQGFQAVAVHGNKSQSARQRSLNAFQDGKYQILVATDVAARGIDIQGISHVINYDLPQEPESYIHRIGRTGRAGEKGIALSFCSQNERRDLRAIEKLIGKRIPMHKAESKGIEPKQQDDDSNERKQEKRPKVGVAKKKNSGGKKRFTPRGKSGFSAGKSGRKRRRKPGSTAAPAKASAK